MIEREAQAVAKLRHENILEIFSYSGIESKDSYLVTEFIHGPTLRRFISDNYPGSGTSAALPFARPRTCDRSVPGRRVIWYIGRLCSSI